MTLPGKVCEVELADVIRAIKNGSWRGIDLISITNQTYQETDDDRLQNLKKNNLPVVLFNGTFSYKNNSSLIQYSNFTAIDFDHFNSESELCAIGRRLMITPCVYCIYRTPSGKGLKAIVMHDNDDSDLHSELYDQLLLKFEIQQTDNSVKDLSRGNYICYDPNVWINENCTPYHFEHDSSHTTKAYQCSSFRAMPLNRDAIKEHLSEKRMVKMKSDKSIIAILNAHWKKDATRWETGNRANSVFYSASELCLCGVDLESALKYLDDSYTTTGLSSEEIEYQALRGYQNNIDDYGIRREKMDSYSSKALYGVQYDKR